MVPEPQAQITEGTISTNGKHLGKHATNGLILIFYVSSSLYLELKKKMIIILRVHAFNNFSTF